jgi:hypothetical protein
MNASQFDSLVGALTDGAAPRRVLVRGLVGAGIAAALMPWGQEELDARRSKKRGKRKKDNKKPKVNRFGCRNVGIACSSANQCCSGICEGRGGKGKNGKKRKKTCRAHDTGGCRADLESCSANRDITCTTTTGEDGFCHITTGNAPYCAFDGIDAECTKDEDCIELCGPLAACSVCAVPGEEEFRFCAGPGSCTGPQPE